MAALSLLPPPSTTTPTLPPHALGNPATVAPLASISMAPTPSLAAGQLQPAHGAPFHLASSFAPIPAKLIQNLEYVDLRELLPDNIALSEKLDALPARANQVPNQEQREITKTVTWVSCFASYVAIVAQKHPKRTRDMLAYMPTCSYIRLMVREGHKHGGTGWLKYDRIFRKNNPGPSASWDVLDPSLLTIVANQGYSPRLPCHHCQELDHMANECALAPLEQPTKALTHIRSPSYPRSGRRPAPYDTSRITNRHLLPSDTTVNTPSLTTSGAHRSRICISWNKGQCAFQGACSYAHICPTCDSGSHKARDCPRTPADSATAMNATRDTQSQNFYCCCVVICCCNGEFVYSSHNCTRVMHFPSAFHCILF